MKKYIGFMLGLGLVLTVFGLSFATNVNDMTGINAKRNATFTGDVTIAGTLAVTGAFTMADGTVTTAKLAADAVTSAKISDEQVTTAKLGVASVSTAKLAVAAVTTAKINDDAVTTGKMLGSVPGGGLCDLGLASGALGTCSNADASVCDCT